MTGAEGAKIVAGVGVGGVVVAVGVAAVVEVGVLVAKLFPP